MNFSFDSEDAKKYGVNSAIILYSLRFWLKKNRANGKNIHDGYVWTYNSLNAWSDIFPFFTAKQVRTAIDKLVSCGKVKTGDYSNDRFKRSKYYTIPDEFRATRDDKTGKSDLPKRSNRVAQMGKCSYTDIYNNTDNIPDNTSDYIRNHSGVDVVKNQIVEVLSNTLSRYKPSTNELKELKSVQRLRNRVDDTEIKSVLEWLIGGDSQAVFWIGTIQSVSGFVKHYDTMFNQMNRPKKTTNKVRNALEDYNKFMEDKNV